MTTQLSYLSTPSFAAAHFDPQATFLRFTTAASLFLNNAVQTIAEGSSLLKNRAIESLQNFRTLSAEADLIQMIREYPHTERTELLEQALPLLLPKMDENSRSNLIQAINTYLDTPQNCSIRDLISLFLFNVQCRLHARTNPSSVEQMITAITTIPADKRAQTLEIGNVFLQHHYLLNDPDEKPSHSFWMWANWDSNFSQNMTKVVATVNCFSHFSTEEQVSILSQAANPFPNRNDFMFELKLLLASKLAPMAEDERTEFVELSRSLIRSTTPFSLSPSGTACVHRDIMRTVIEELEKVPRNARQSVAAGAQNIVKAAGGSYAKNPSLMQTTIQGLAEAYAGGKAMGEVAPQAALSRMLGVTQ